MWGFYGGREYHKLVSAATPDRLRAAYRTARDSLLAERTPDGHWVGELSSSALSTATAVTALAVAGRSEGPDSEHEALIDLGLCWLADHQNADGGWGDTVKSVSNISTTMLCRAAFHATSRADRHANALKRCEAWLAEHFGQRTAELAEAVRRRYGDDRTFSVPILMMCALAGLVPWREVPRLPFEVACLPQSWYRLARMPVVSYALPALIAIGQVIHFHRSTWNPITWLLRRLGRRRSLRVLERIQPSSGGYLEATPLTSFVVMSLAALQRPKTSPPSTPPPRSGEGGNRARLSPPTPLRGGGPGGRGSTGTPADRVIAHGVKFIINSVRPDGSWPIDTNLSIWVTTLSVNALAAAGDLESLDRRTELLTWLFDQQTKDIHPYTGAAGGAWGWSDEPGSVPDCDDTPGALLAVRALAGDDAPAKIDRFVRATVGDIQFTEAFHTGRLKVRVKSMAGELGFHVLNGLGWLRDLQNRDQGWPTFCRGWGRLPFDRSGSDLTAHALRAFAAWGEPSLATSVAGVLLDPMIDVRVGSRPIRFISRRQVREAITSGFAYLSRLQRPDGSWLPLWFGNQHAPEDVNPVYGTARVLAAYRDLNQANTEEARRGVAFLLDVQNPGGGWGGAKDTPSSVEETALAVEILVDLAAPEARPAVERGIEYLVHRVEDGTFSDPAPIGFYFAKLWYFEKLYPITFTVAALGRAVRRLA
jgi:squalene-hopene/tetraprenyl-beta-curcumene cyclase